MPLLLFDVMITSEDLERGRQALKVFTLERRVPGENRVVTDCQRALAKCEVFAQSGELLQGVFQHLSSEKLPKWTQYLLAMKQAKEELLELIKVANLPP